MAIDEELLKIIVCPKCKGGVDLSKDSQSLVCSKCNLKYQIREGIPILLIDEAQEISPAEHD